METRTLFPVPPPVSLPLTPLALLGVLSKLNACAAREDEEGQPAASKIKAEQRAFVKEEVR